MIQRFIELGEGYGDLYELIELAKANRSRVAYLLSLQTVVNGKEVCSPAVILNPASEGNFQPIYISREGIPNSNVLKNKRFSLFQEMADNLGKDIISVDVKPSTMFAEKELYYQYLTGILRMNRYLLPLR